MNILKNNKIQKDPFLLKNLEDAKNKRDEISNIIFDKEKILKFND